jgi:arsenate reductase (thioredoxin)
MKLLFICTHNACRSILSEAMTRQIAPGRIEVASAGSSPADQVHPLTLEHLKNHGYSTEGLYSKSIDAVRPFEPNVVVTVCDNAAKESCPIWLGIAIKVHWGLSDPSRHEGADEDKAEVFTKVMATIERRIGRLLEHPFETMDAEQLAAVFSEIGGQS